MFIQSPGDLLVCGKDGTHLSCTAAWYKLFFPSLVSAATTHIISLSPTLSYYDRKEMKEGQAKEGQGSANNRKGESNKAATLKSVMFTRNVRTALCVAIYIFSVLLPFSFLFLSGSQRLFACPRAYSSISVLSSTSKLTSFPCG